MERAIGPYKKDKIVRRIKALSHPRSILGYRRTLLDKIPRRSKACHDHGSADSVTCASSCTQVTRPGFPHSLSPSEEKHNNKSPKRIEAVLLASIAIPAFPSPYFSATLTIGTCVFGCIYMHCIRRIWYDASDTRACRGGRRRWRRYDTKGR